MGIAFSVALAAGIAPATAIAAEANSPVGAVALQTAAVNSSETAAAEKEKAYAAMQEALKNLEAAKKKIAESMMTLPLLKSSTALCWRKPPNGRNPFLL